MDVFIRGVGCIKHEMQRGMNDLILPGNQKGGCTLRLDVSTRIEERHGCDTSPIDPSTDEGALTLQSYVWPDQMERFRRLTAAIDVARRVSAPVDHANAADWIEAALAGGVSGVATVVYHSIVWQYLSNADRALK
jgi:hypothetical protein